MNKLRCGNAHALPARLRDIPRLLVRHRNKRYLVPNVPIGLLFTSQQQVFGVAGRSSSEARSFMYVWLGQSSFFFNLPTPLGFLPAFFSSFNISYYGQVKKNTAVSTPACCLDSTQAWNVTSHTLTAASAPVPANLPLLLPLSSEPEPG